MVLVTPLPRWCSRPGLQLPCLIPRGPSPALSMVVPCLVWGAEGHLTVQLPRVPEAKLAHSKSLV